MKELRIKVQLVDANPPDSILPIVLTEITLISELHVVNQATIRKWLNDIIVKYRKYKPGVTTNGT